MTRLCQSTVQALKTPMGGKQLELAPYVSLQ